jgi:hypothetical protein
MKLKHSLAIALALALGVAATAAAASDVTRTYKSGAYKYTCIKMGAGEYCGNFMVVH